MGMLRSTEHSAAGQCSAADAVTRQHAFNSQHHRFFRVFAHQFGILDLFQAANPTGMMAVIFLLQFFAGQNCFLRVDDDDMVTAISVRGKVYFVLAAQNRSGNGRSAAEGFVSSVKNLRVISPAFGIVVDMVFPSCELLLHLCFISHKLLFLLRQSQLRRLQQVSL